MWILPGGRAVHPGQGELRSCPRSSPERGDRRRGGQGVWRNVVSKARLTRVLALAAIASFALSACAANSDNGSGNGATNGGSTKVDIPVVTNLPVSPNAAKAAG